MFWFQFYSDPKLWPQKYCLLGQHLAKNFFLGTWRTSTHGVPKYCSATSLRFFNYKMWAWLGFSSPPKFCGICSDPAHASSSKGFWYARIKKGHHQGIAGHCSFPPKRSVRYIATSTHLESSFCVPLLLSTGTYALHLEGINKNEFPNVYWNDYASNCTTRPLPILLVLTLKMADNTTLHQFAPPIEQPLYTVRMRYAR